MKKRVALLLAAAIGLAEAETSRGAAPVFDAALAERLGADDHGMQSYVLVILKTGPNRKAAGPERDEMFKGHFANIQRLAAEKKIAYAGPFEDFSGRNVRGMFILRTASLDEAKSWVETDPAVKAGRLKPEFLKWYVEKGALK